MSIEIREKISVQDERMRNKVKTTLSLLQGKRELVGGGVFRDQGKGGEIENYYFVEMKSMGESYQFQLFKNQKMFSKFQLPRKKHEEGFIDGGAWTAKIKLLAIDK